MCFSCFTKINLSTNSLGDYLSHSLIHFLDQTSHQCDQDTPTIFNTSKVCTVSYKFAHHLTDCSLPWDQMQYCLAPSVNVLICSEPLQYMISCHEAWTDPVQLQLNNIANSNFYLHAMHYKSIKHVISQTQYILGFQTWDMSSLYYTCL